MTTCLPYRDGLSFIESLENAEEQGDLDTVMLEFEEPGKVERGNFGRLLAYVFVDGSNVNVEMVRQGWSRFYTKYGEGRYADEFEAAEAAQKSACRGS